MSRMCGWVRVPMCLVHTHRHEAYIQTHAIGERTESDRERANEQAHKTENSVIEEPLRVFDVRGGACSLPTLKYPYRQFTVCYLQFFVCVISLSLVCRDATTAKSKEKKKQNEKREKEEQTCFSVLFRVHSVLLLLRYVAHASEYRESCIHIM